MGLDERAFIPYRLSPSSPAAVLVPDAIGMLENAELGRYPRRETRTDKGRRITRRPSCELPEFYTPYPARCNPHLDRARAHSKAWARSMDMIDVPQHGTVIWTEGNLDAHDYALLCAYTHPDITAELLDLVTDWYVWVFYFDDHFLALFKRTRDLDGARAYLAAMRAFMPADGQINEKPTNPVEAGLADLWSRTLPDRSADWRA